MRRAEAPWKHKFCERFTLHIGTAVRSDLAAMRLLQGHLLTDGSRPNHTHRPTGDTPIHVRMRRRNSLVYAVLLHCTTAKCATKRVSHRTARETAGSRPNHTHRPTGDT